MARCKSKGYTIEIELDDYGYEGYSVECRYIYNKRIDKYMLSMWLICRGIDDRFKIDGQEIDTQPVRGTRETIKDNICRIVKQASLSGFFDSYINSFEYMYKCFDKGDEFYRKEEK